VSFCEFPLKLYEHVRRGLSGSKKITSRWFIDQLS
jgi:hypothetical protein